MRAPLLVLPSLLLLAPAPSARQDGGPADAELEERVAALVLGGLERERVPGAAVVVVREGEVRLARGFGLADVASERPVDPERTVWRLGSVSKALTGLAALVLADRGRLGLDDRVEEHVPGLVPRVERFGEPLRVRHLLEHTGGFDQLGSRRNFDDPAARPGLRAFLQRDLVRIRPPGVVRCYDTYGISLLGELVAEVVGRPYGEAMDELVFAPAGMHHTWVETPGAQRGSLATGYGLDGGELVPQAYEYYASLPASSIDATAADVGRLMVALLDPGAGDERRLLSPAGLSPLLGAGDGPAERFPGYADGFWVARSADVRVLHHGGTNRGYSAELTLVPALGVGVFVAANRDGETGPPLAFLEGVTAAALELCGVPDGPSALADPEGPAVTAEACAGPYVQNLWCHTCLEGEGWAPGEPLVVRALEGDALELWGERWERCAPREFRRSGHAGRVGFETDGRGRVARFLLSWTPGTVYERLDEGLLDEVLGPRRDADLPTPLAALVARANGRWEEAARIYAGLASGCSEGTPARAAADFRAGQALARLGDAEGAEPLLLEALEASRALAGSDAPAAASQAERVREVFLELAIARAQSGDLDAALEWMETAMFELEISADRMRRLVAENPWLAPLRGSPGLAELGR